MRKLREDSIWSRLTVAQRDQLDGWLFEENLGYAEARDRVQKEFGLDTKPWCVGRFYRRRVRERQVEGLAEASVDVDRLNAIPVNLANLREAALKLTGTALMKLSGEKPQEAQQLVAFTRLLLESEENDIRRERLKLSQRQFDYMAMAGTIEDLPDLRSYLISVRNDSSLTEMEKLERIHAIILGKDNPNAIITGMVPVPHFSQEIRDLHPEMCTSEGGEICT